MEYTAHIDSCRQINGCVTQQRWAITWRNDDYACHVGTMWHLVGTTEQDVLEAWYKI